jgi:hypothetical protein
MSTDKSSRKDAGNGVSFNLATLIGVGAGLGLGLGSLLGDLVSGMMYGVGAGVVIGSVLAMDWRRTDTGSDIPRPSALRWLMGCLAFLSVSALFGGVVLVGSPSGAGLHIPLSVLRDSPFSDFLIPGLILGLIFGVGSFVTVLALWWRPTWPPAGALTRLTGEHWAWSAALALGIGQIIWIITETLMLRGASWLGLLYGSLGVLIVVLALQPDVRQALALNGASRRP